MNIHRMNDDGLLECPFCGRGDAYLSTSKSGWSHVACFDCGAGGDERSIIRAKNSWNTRNGKLYTVESMRRADEEGDME